jgi:hypothetical protein
MKKYISNILVGNCYENNQLVNVCKFWAEDSHIELISEQ